MAEHRSRVSVLRRRWPALIAAGVAVISAGFALGLAAGIIWEEPGLVVAYFTGDTERIDWGADPNADETVADLDPPKTPDVAAAPPLGTRDVPKAPTPQREKTEPAKISRAAKPPDPPAAQVATPPSTAGFSVQVGAFSDKKTANDLAESLRQAGYRVYLSRGEGEAGTWRVRVGPMPSREEAERAGHQLKSKQKLPIWVLSEDS
jgi:cell division septation protein DedD